MRAGTGALAGAEHLQPAVPAKSGSLGTRVVVGLFLALVAVADIWIGGPAFALMIAVGVGLVFWEWGAMHAVPAPWRIAGLAALGLVSLVTQLGQAAVALALLGSVALLLLAASIFARVPGRRWLSTGLLYAGLPAVSLIWLRGQADGFALVMWTMGLVWATDIFAYFVGRTIGGPKIWPAISPNKTWAGLIGGMKAAAIFSGLFAWAAGWPVHPLIYALLGAGLAIVAQAGDFFESWLKRSAGVKDSGSLLPGHGGLMDRVDGLVPVACLVALWVSVQAPVQWVAAFGAEAAA